LSDIAPGVIEASVLLQTLKFIVSAVMYGKMLKVPEVVGA
jgi:hypothetical protein